MPNLSTIQISVLLLATVITPLLTCHVNDKKKACGKYVQGISLEQKRTTI